MVQTMNHAILVLSLSKGFKLLVTVCESITAESTIYITRYSEVSLSSAEAFCHTVVCRWRVHN